MKTMTVKELNALIANAEWNHRPDSHDYEEGGFVLVSSKTDGIELVHMECFSINDDGSRESTGEYFYVYGVDILDDDGDSIVSHDDELLIDHDDVPSEFKSVTYDYI